MWLLISFYTVCIEIRTLYQKVSIKNDTLVHSFIAQIRELPEGEGGNEPQHNKTNKLTVCPAKTQISLDTGLV